MSHTAMDTLEENGEPASAADAADDDWTDDKCIEIAFTDYFPDRVKSIAVQKNIVNRFLNFYLRGKPPVGYTVSDVVFAMISILPKLDKGTEELIWHQLHYKNDGKLFFLSPEDRLNADYAVINQKTDQNEENTVSKHEADNVDDATEDASPETRSSDSDDVTQTETDKAPSSATPPPQSDSSQTEPTHDTPESETKKIWWFGAKSSVDKSVQYIDYEPVDNTNFVIKCNQLLNVWESSENARIQLKYFFGIIALTFMRATVKSIKHMKNIFLSKKIINLISLSPYHISISYVKPHERCIKNCFKEFRSVVGNTRTMFAKIVIDGVFFKHERINIFRATVLVHTADYGMGVLNLLQRVLAGGYKDNHSKVEEATRCDETADSWNRIKDHITKYKRDPRGKMTHYWAGLINRQFFESLSCENNYELSIIFAVFIEKLTTDKGVWKASWLKRDGLKEYQQLGETTDKIKLVGETMYKKYNTLLDEEWKLFLTKLIL